MDCVVSHVNLPAIMEHPPDRPLLIFYLILIGATCNVKSVWHVRVCACGAWGMTRVLEDKLKAYETKRNEIKVR